MKSYNLSLSLAQRPNNTSTVDFLRVTLVPAMAEPHVGRGSRCSAEGQRVAAVFMAGHQFLPFNMSPEKETGLSVRDDGAFFTALSPLLLCPSVQGPDTAFWSWLEELIKDTHTHTHTHTHTRTHTHTHTQAWVCAWNGQGFWSWQLHWYQRSTMLLWFSSCCIEK